jgi:predicted nucleotidyltransferase
VLTHGLSALSMPKLGSKMPGMGISSVSKPTARQHTSLADALFSTTQQRVLALLFGQPERSFYKTELIARAEGGSGAIQRELARLEQSGLVTVRRIGNQKHYQANPAAPIFAELHSIALKTVGLAEPIRAALAPVARQIRAAFVYGSIAKRQDAATSDIDLMIVSDKLTYGDVFAAVEEVGAKLGRPINPTVYTTKEMSKRVKQDNAFIKRVMAQPKLWLIGREDDLPA